MVDDKFDSFNKVKQALIRATEIIIEQNFRGRMLMPVIVVDYYREEINVFDRKYEAEDYLQRYTEWDEYPPEGEDDELVAIKFCTEEAVKRHSFLTKQFKFFKDVDGVKIYRQKSYVEFEQELIVHAHI